MPFSTSILFGEGIASRKRCSLRSPLHGYHSVASLEGFASLAAAQTLVLCFKASPIIRQRHASRLNLSAPAKNLPSHVHNMRKGYAVSGLRNSSCKRLSTPQEHFLSSFVDPVPVWPSIGPFFWRTFGFQDCKRHLLCCRCILTGKDEAQLAQLGKLPAKHIWQTCS